MALLLSTEPLPACCVAPAPRFAGEVDRAKEQRDNVAHFVVPAAITTGTYGLAKELGASRSEARWIAIGTSMLIVVGKEIYDQSVAGRFGLEEVALGVGGTVTGVVIAERIWRGEAQASGLGRSSPARRELAH